MTMFGRTQLLALLVCTPATTAFFMPAAPQRVASPLQSSFMETGTSSVGTSGFAEGYRPEDAMQGEGLPGPDIQERSSANGIQRYAAPDGGRFERYDPARHMTANPTNPHSSMHKEGGTLQGGSRRTWGDPYGNKRSQVVTLQTEGRPLNGELSLWEGPGNTASKVKVWSEDGRARPFSAVVQTPRSNTVDIRNTGPMEFPINAGVGSMGQQEVTAIQLQDVAFSSPSITVQGGSLKTVTLDPLVGSVVVSIRSEGMPIMATVEVWQGPGTVKQVAEVYADDGRRRPFCAVVETPGYGSTICVRNSGPVEFPVEINVEPYSEQSYATSGQSPYDSNQFFNGNQIW